MSLVAFLHASSDAARIFGIILQFNNNQYVSIGRSESMNFGKGAGGGGDRGAEI